MNVNLMNINLRTAQLQARPAWLLPNLKIAPYHFYIYSAHCIIRRRTKENKFRRLELYV